MILKETILSAFTERGTLLQWLKKVEAALKDAVLTDISVEQISATQIKLKFTFENGDYIESPIITLPRGEKGENGKDGLDGEGIAATVEVGTVTTGAAGTNASVTNVGTEQKAILNFVIPRGDTGVGFDDASMVELNDSPEVLLGTDGFTVEGNMKVTAGEEVFEIPSKMIIPFKSGEGIIIDVDVDGNSIEVHLDAEVTAKLSRVLVTPMSAPTSVSLVAVDTSNAQSMLTLGEGLKVEDGIISATGASSGGGEVWATQICGMGIHDDSTVKRFNVTLFTKQALFTSSISNLSTIYNALNGIIGNCAQSGVGFAHSKTSNTPTQTYLGVIISAVTSSSITFKYYSSVTNQTYTATGESGEIVALQSKQVI